MRLRAPFPTIRLVLALYVVAGCIFSLTTPLFDVSDELRHVAMVEHYAMGRGLPVQNPAQHEFYEQEGSQPPLYYFALAGIAQAFDLSDFRTIAQINPHGRLGRADATDNRNQMLAQSPAASRWRGTALFVLLMRLLGVACGAVTVWAVWRCATLSSKALGRAQHVPLLAALLTGFNPMFVFIQASVTNDVFVTTFGSLAFLVGLNLLHSAGTTRMFALMGGLLGLAILSKSSGLAIAAGVIVTLALQTAITRKWRNVPRLVLSVTIMLSICGWWYVRNWQLYGEFTGTRMMASIAGPRVPPLESYFDLVWEWDGFFKAYWGLFGAVNIPMHDAVYTALSTITALACIGLMLRIFRGSRPQPMSTRMHEPAPTPGAFPALMLATSFFVAFTALCVWTAMTLASQGRLLFPVIVPISIFLALGLTRLLPDGFVAHGVRGIGIALASLTLIAPIIYIRPAYSAPPRLAAMPAVTRTVELRYGDEIRWVGYTVSQTYEHRKPGDTFEVTLYWQALKPIDKDYSLFIKLFDYAGNEVARSDATPGGGMLQTSLWQPGEIIEDRYRLRLDNALTLPTVLWLDAGFYTFETKANLPVFDASGASTGRQRYPVAGVSADAQARPVLPASGRFAFGTRVDGPPQGKLDVKLSLASGSNQLAIATYWQPDATFDRDYTMFAQLLDPDGKVIAQADGLHMAGRYPARWWARGDIVQDTRSMQVAEPNQLLREPLGYTLLIGLYHNQSGERLPIYLENGSRAANDALSIRLTSQNVTVSPR